MGLEIGAVPLRGINLVEASAGTGKTHALTGLYLRMVLETEFPPESILVMTYTQAATAELKERIRRRLIQARSLLEGEGSEETELRPLLAACGDPALARRRLDLAIAGFDQAAVHTIHGFCQRVLTEQAFETGQSFQVELVPDQSTRRQQVVDDFWRREQEQLPDLFLEAFRKQIQGPEALLARLSEALGKPYLQVRAAAWPEDLAELEEAANTRREALRQIWGRESGTIQGLLSDTKRLNGRRYRQDWVASWCLRMGEWLAQTPYEQPFDKVERFTPAFIQESLKPRQLFPEHPFFEGMAAYLTLAERCREAYTRACVALQRRCHAYLLEELPRRQAEAGEWSYDDLLLQLNQALQGEPGARLAVLLRRRYPAALVDEFQDTDPVQYEILRRIYHGHGQALFLVGDPKQAIYSFRGADIFAYLQARREAGAALHTLDRNWRSTPALVGAVNRLFASSPRPFFYPQIAFHPVTPAPRSMEALTVRGEGDAALHLWHLPFDRSVPVEEVRRVVAQATAGEIARLLRMAEQGRARIGGRSLGGGDFAVLVRTHRQGERIAQALLRLGVKSVRCSQESVYWSQEAEALERLLMALLEPRRTDLLRAALATPLLGWDAAAIDALNRDDQALGEIAARFFAFHRLWRSQGFMGMFRRLLLAEAVENRLLALQDGERRLTNLTHLAELLHQQDSAARSGMEGLLKWLVRQRRSSSRDEERLLRLESDGRLVKIHTLHVSKGLEYPIVFCPYLWDSAPEPGGDTPYLFHDPGQAYQPVLELGSVRFEADRARQREEALAEGLRLLYVGLTRACHRCYLPWGAVKNSENSALAWLLHRHEMGTGEIDLEDWTAHAKSLDSEAAHGTLRRLQEGGEGQIALATLPKEAEMAQLSLEIEPELAPSRRFRGRILPARQVASFSSLVAGRSEDRPDHDDLEGAEARLTSPAEGFDIHGFPRGAGPGSCLHAVLEQCDFTQVGPGIDDTSIRERLRFHGIDEHWAPVVVELLGRLVSTPLDAAGLHLGAVRRERRIDELEFHFPVSGLDPAAIRRLASQHHFSEAAPLVEGLGGVEGTRLEGFMKGFIDLVFEWQGRYYLADYKSNWLGPTVEDYHPRALHAAMREHHYSLQYALYTLALHRYLGLRLPGYDYERHFGGVFYLFLRGMQPVFGARFGVVAERPSQGFIQALDTLMRERAP